MIEVKCPHDNAELELIPDEKTPNGLLQCPKCHCIFRVCLSRFDAKCYGKMYLKELDDPAIERHVSAGRILANEIKRKRGRPRKVIGNV